MDELYRSLEVGLVELIRNIPAQSTILSALLHHSVKEGRGVKETGPLVGVGVIEQILEGKRLWV